MAQQTFSGVPGTFSAGEILTASDQEKLREFILYLIKDGDEGDTGEVSPLILDLGSDIVNIVGELVVGVDGTGHDVKFFGDTATNGYLKWDQSTDDLVLGSSSRLGIGTDSPGAKLDITDATDAYIHLNDSGGTVGAATNSRLQFQAGGSVAGQVGFLNTSAGSMSVDVEDGDLYLVVASADSIYFRTTDVTRMELDATGNLTLTGTPSGGAPYDKHIFSMVGGGFYSFGTQSMINAGGATGTVALAGGAPGLLLNSPAMNSTSWATPPLFFSSTDSAFTTESPKNLACIVGRATATYNADSSSGMGITMKLTANAAGTDDLLDGSVYGYTFGTTSLNAYTDNTASCGLSARLWTVIYAASGTIDTSDVRDKTDIADLDYGLDFVNSLRPVSYRYAFRNEEVEGVRTHMGFVAQEVEEVLGDEASNMGVWTTSEFEETGDWDENDEPIYSDADRQGLRYGEMVAPLVKAVQELTSRIAALEATP